MKRLNARAVATLEGGAWAGNMNNMLAFYNSAVKRFNDTYPYANRTTRARAVDNFITLDVKKISCIYNVKQELIRGKVFEFEETSLTQSPYRPFTRQ